MLYRIKMKRSAAGVRAKGLCLGTALVLALLVLAHFGAGAAGAQEKVPGSEAAKSRFHDPFRYCAAVENADRPGPRWAGPKVPRTIVSGMERDGILQDVPGPQMERGIFWRCMDGGVEVCFVGANIPCSEKADTRRAPSSKVVDYCKANPKAKDLPAYVTGHTTIYAWSCTGGKPQITERMMEPDARGFLPAYWKRLAPPP